MEWHCPICRKATDSTKDNDFPFCSERCRSTDLGNWATEKYKVSEAATDESLPESHQTTSHELSSREASPHEAFPRDEHEN
ncbi:MAG: DNA gyrase inhibitor YacG [Candidatus Acidiferrales bacterium]